VPYTSGAPTANFPTGAVLWSLSGSSPAGMTIDPGTGVVSWPNPDLSGSPYTLTTMATDGCGNASRTWTLTVNPNSPSINPSPDAFAVCGVAYTGPTPTAIGGISPLTWNLVTGPGGMTIDPSTGVVSWPNPFVTAQTVVLQASSAGGCGLSRRSSWHITVVAGDFDADGVVGETDIPAFVDNLLQDSPTCAGDLNGDSLVDGNDIASFDAALGL